MNGLNFKTMQGNTYRKKLIICSGGLDSISMALMETQDANAKITLMTFDYGQKAKNELMSVKNFADRHNIEFHIEDISALSPIFGKNQLTDENTDIEDIYHKDVVVPLRNALFLQIAMIYAYTHEYDEVILGSHMDDCEEQDGERLFPDCSPEFFKAFELASDFGTFRRQKKVKIKTASLLGLGKKELLKRAYEINKEDLFLSWSCYKSEEKQCGECDSCKNRKKAFEEAGIKDETKYIR